METQLDFENNNKTDSGLSSAVLDDVVGMAWQRELEPRCHKDSGSTGWTEGERSDKPLTKEDSSKLDQLNVIEYPSPNHSSRDGQKIQTLVLHYTAEPEAQALKTLTNPNAGVSSHYLVGPTGKIYHLVNHSEASWHAGYSHWDGVNNVNRSSIGIEIANMGNEPYPEAQMTAVKELCKAILQENDIPADHVVGHSDVANTRRNSKIDPGWYFDWKSLADEGIGIWPTPEQVDYDTSRNWSDAVLKQKLDEYGYWSESELPSIVGAFQRHFQPEIGKTPSKIGIADAETKARLAWLLRNKAQ